MGVGQADSATAAAMAGGVGRGGRRFAQVLGWTLIWTGIFLFGYVGWLVFGTDVVNAQVQEVEASRLEQRFDEEPPEVEPTPEVVEDEDESEQDEGVERIVEDTPAAGTGFAFMRVPRVGLEAVVFEGIDTETLQKGPGHMPDTPLPGQPGNSVISGHRTTYGRPFHDFDLLVAGDRVEIETKIGTHVYEVRDVFIVAPTDVWVTEPRSGAWLTMTTCNPKYSARERLIVLAELVSGPNAEYVVSLGEPAA
jgi:sortase A